MSKTTLKETLRNALDAVFTPDPKKLNRMILKNPFEGAEHANLHKHIANAGRIQAEQQAERGRYDMQRAQLVDACINAVLEGKPFALEYYDRDRTLEARNNVFSAAWKRAGAAAGAIAKKVAVRNLPEVQKWISAREASEQADHASHGLAHSDSPILAAARELLQKLERLAKTEDPNLQTAKALNEIL